MVDDSKENDLIKTLSLRKVQLLNEMQESQIVLANAQARVQEIDKELNLLSSLLDLHLNQQGTVVNDDKNPPENNDNYLKEPIRIAQQFKSKSSRFEAAIKDILKDFEKQNGMHIKDIKNELRRRKIAIPGLGTMANIITRMRRANDTFVRVAPGTYALTEAVIETAEPEEVQTSNKRNN